jgi:hypothetical protein
VAGHPSVLILASSLTLHVLRASEHRPHSQAPSEQNPMQCQPSFHQTPRPSTQSWETHNKKLPWTPNTCYSALDFNNLGLLSFPGASSEPCSLNCIIWFFSIITYSTLMWDGTEDYRFVIRIKKMSHFCCFALILKFNQWNTENWNPQYKLTRFMGLVPHLFITEAGWGHCKKDNAQCPAPTQSACWRPGSIFLHSL